MEIERLLEEYLKSLPETTYQEYAPENMVAEYFIRPFIEFLKSKGLQVLPNLPDLG